VFIELPYSEDMREFVFPPIISDNNKPTKEQLDAVDALIENMGLQAVRFCTFIYSLLCLVGGFRWYWC
jgi:uncharacterized protein YbbC (DUF1343 family)